MYTYYAIAALGPEYQKYVWWKLEKIASTLNQYISMHYLQEFIQNLMFKKICVVLQNYFTPFKTIYHSLVSDLNPNHPKTGTIA